MLNEFFVCQTTAEAGEIATQSTFFAAGWSDELDQSEDDVQEALELAGESDVKSPGLVASPRGF